MRVEQEVHYLGRYSTLSAAKMILLIDLSAGFCLCKGLPSSGELHTASVSYRTT